MSTLKVNTIQNTSGGSSSTPTQIYGGRARFWVTFQGTGTVAIEDDFNVDSITDNGTGDYRVNIGSAFDNNVYAVFMTNTVFSNGRCGARVRPDGGMSTNQTTTTVRCQFTADGGMTDQNRAYIIGFGDM